MKTKILEAGKSLLIIVLICTLLLLTVAAMPKEMIRGTPWLSNVLQPLAPFLGLQEAELTYVEDAQPVLNAAQPLRITVGNTAGRYSAQWDFASLDSAFDMLGGLLGQALDTAEELTEVPSSRLTAALSNPSVCFDYGFPISARLLGSWLDAASVTVDGSGEQYILAVEEGRVNLYLSGKDNFCAATSVDGAALLSVLESVKPDGSLYGFETDTRLQPLALLPGSKPRVETAETANPCDSRYLEALATALGFNPYDENRYTDSAGVTWFSETNCSLQIDLAGHVLLSSTSADRFQADNHSAESLVELARELVHLTVGNVLGEARIYLNGVTLTDTETTVTFDYVLRGIPVTCSSGPAASLTFSGQSLTEMSVQVMSFACTGEAVQLLPPTQAAAIIPMGGKLNLKYSCAGFGPMGVGWVK